jgi:MFS family permease
VTFNMSEAWRDATAMMSGNREVLLIVAGLFFFLPSLVLNFAMGDPRNVAVADPQAAEAAVAATYTQWWWLLGLISVVSVVGSLALLALLRDHERPTVAEAIKAGLVGLLPAIGTYVLMALGALLIIVLTSAILGPVFGVDSANPTVGQLVPIATIALLILIYPAVKFSLSTPVIAIDKVRNPIKILARSWRLTKGNSFRLFLFYFLLGVVYLVVGMVVAIVVGAFNLVAGPGAGLIISALIAGALSAATSVVAVAVIAAAHRQLAGPSAEAATRIFE